MRLFILLYLLLPLSAFAQYNLWDTTATAACGFYKTEIDRLTIDYFYEDGFCWSDWEKTITKKKKEKIKKRIKGEKQPGVLEAIDEFGHYSGEGDTVRTKFNPLYMHVIDFDGDGDDDFVYEHFVHWEKTLYLEFWQNTGKTWVLLNRVEGHVLAIKKEANNPLVFTTYHNHCCGDYTHYFYTFTVADEPVMLKKEAFIGKLPLLKAEMHQSPKLKSIQLENDTLFCFGGRIHGNKRIKVNKAFRPGLAEPSAIVKGKTTAKILGVLNNLYNNNWYLVALDPSTEFKVHAYEKNHRNRWFDIPITYIGLVPESTIENK